jgi:pyrroline-5-carboxylate reductase
VKKKIGVIGVGRLGEAIVRGLQRHSSRAFSIEGSVRSTARAQKLCKSLGIKMVADNRRVVTGAEIVLLCVKPHQAEKVLKELRPKLRKSQLLISVCASITLKQLKSWTGNRCRLLRAMPNLPSFIGQGMTVLAYTGEAQRQDLEVGRKIFESMGAVLTLDEAHLDAVTALSACGPAFVFVMIEALSDAGVKVGLPRDHAMALVLQTMVGSAEMVRIQKQHPARLKDQVTTPGGCTIDGLLELEKGNLRATLMKCIVASARKASRLRSR